MGGGIKAYNYKLRLFISLKYITANVLDQSNGNLIAQASTIEPAVKGAFDVGRTTTPTSAAIVGQVLARRIKLQALHHHHRRELELERRSIEVDVRKEVEKKGVDDLTSNANIVWAILNALKANGIRIGTCDYNHSTI